MSQQCNEEGYAGNDTLCARDSDRDNFPDVKLDCDEPTCSMVCYSSIADYLLYYDFMLRMVVLILLERRGILVNKIVCTRLLFERYQLV